MTQECKYVYHEEKGWIEACNDCPWTTRVICRLHRLVLCCRLPWHFVRCARCLKLRWPPRLWRKSDGNKGWYCSRECEEALPF